MREAIPENRLQYAGWPVVGACGIGAFFATAPLTTFAVFLQPLCDEFSWSREAASSAFGTLTLMAAASAPWLGGLLDRFGVRRVVVACLAVSGCAVASLAALTPALAHLRIVFGLLGLVMMGASPIAYSRAIFGWFDRSRGRALGAMLAGASLSGIVLPPVAQGFIDLWGWRIAWLVLGCATLAAGTFALATAQSFAMGIVATVCLGFGSGGETDVTPYLLSRHFGLRSLSTLYGLNWTAWGLAGVAGPILLGRAFDATGSYTVALVELGLITSVAAVLRLTVPRVPLAAAAPRVVEERI